MLMNIGPANCWTAKHGGLGSALNTLPLITNFKGLMLAQRVSKQLVL